MASPRRESNPKTCIAPLQEQGRTDRIRPAPLLDVYSAPRKEFAITMAGMISLPSISRLALAAALLVPTIAHASELTPEQMAWYRAQMGLASVRSEEHTSELQSLMRLSYAVFCLKNKKPIEDFYTITHDEYTKNIINIQTDKQTNTTMNE